MQWYNDRPISNGNCRCSNCDSYHLISTREGDWVCFDCGLCIAPVFVLGNHYSESAILVSRSIYRHRFHFAERLSQMREEEPVIPDELFDLLRLEYVRTMEHSTPAEELTKNQIREICRSVKLSKSLQEKYRSQKFKRKPMLDLTRYTEKHFSIRTRLLNKRQANTGVMYSAKKYPFRSEHSARMRKWFDLLLPGWEKLRHTAECTEQPKHNAECHKLYGCRHNIPNLDMYMTWMLAKLLEDEAELLWWQKFLPPLKDKRKRRETTAFINSIHAYFKFTHEDKDITEF